MVTGVLYSAFEFRAVLDRLRNEIDTLMAKYVGNEHVMYLKICNKCPMQPFCCRRRQK